MIVETTTVNNQKRCVVKLDPKEARIPQIIQKAGKFAKGNLQEPNDKAFLYFCETLNTDKSITYVFKVDEKQTTISSYKDDEGTWEVFMEEVYF